MVKIIHNFESIVNKYATDVPNAGINKRQVLRPGNAITRGNGYQTLIQPQLVHKIFLFADQVRAL